MTKDYNLADDLLEGARRISRYTGFSTRQVYYRAARGQLPVVKLGATIIGRKSQLNRALAKGGRS